MRKFALSTIAAVAMVGFTMATEVTFVKWDGDKNEMTVKDGDKESTYKVTDKTTVTVNDKEVKLEDAKKNWVKNAEKMAGKSKLDITVEKDTITAIKSKGGKGKPKDKDKN